MSVYQFLSKALSHGTIDFEPTEPNFPAAGMWWYTNLLQASNIVYLGVQPVEEEDEIGDDYSASDIGESYQQ